MGVVGGVLGHGTKVTAPMVDCGKSTEKSNKTAYNFSPFGGNLIHFLEKQQVPSLLPMKQSAVFSQRCEMPNVFFNQR